MYDSVWVPSQSCPPWSCCKVPLYMSISSGYRCFTLHKFSMNCISSSFFARLVIANILKALHVSMRKSLIRKSVNSLTSLRFSIELQGSSSKFDAYSFCGFYFSSCAISFKATWRYFGQSCFVISLNSRIKLAKSPSTSKLLQSYSHKS